MTLQCYKKSLLNINISLCMTFLGRISNKKMLNFSVLPSLFSAQNMYPCPRLIYFNAIFVIDNDLLS